ncbi:hypothetical protein EMPS_10503 [Entomortierella parvispora]|uniref:Uncharacterized protein n=1 Tax=Entomortierella parvispora TaxID=205924 RepID=A0A9P3M189_9FUNG|nr:hypothetical protein EMPS_10503 [Entomortierella parvispora]
MSMGINAAQPRPAWVPRVCQEIGSATDQPGVLILDPTRTAQEGLTVVIKQIKCPPFKKKVIPHSSPPTDKPNIQKMTTTSLIPESTFRPHEHNEDGEAPPPYSATAESTSSMDGMYTGQQQQQQQPHAPPLQSQLPDQGSLPPLALMPTRLPSAPNMTEEDFDPVHRERPFVRTPSLTPSQSSWTGEDEKSKAPFVHPPLQPLSTTSTTTTAAAAASSWISQEQIAQNIYRPRPTPSMPDLSASVSASPPPPPPMALTQPREIAQASAEERKGPGLVVHYRCQECGGKLESESEVCKRVQCFSRTVRKSLKAPAGQGLQHRPLSMGSAGSFTDSREMQYHTTAHSQPPLHPQPALVYYTPEPDTLYGSSSSSSSSAPAPHAPYGSSSSSSSSSAPAPHAPYGSSSSSSSSSPSSPSSSSVAHWRTINYTQTLKNLSMRSPVVSSVKKFWKDVQNEYRYQSGSASPSGYYRRPAVLQQHSNQMLDYVVAPAPLPLIGGQNVGSTHPPGPQQYPSQPGAQAQAPLGPSGTDSGYPSRRVPNS